MNKLLAFALILLSSNAMAWQAMTSSGMVDVNRPDFEYRKTYTQSLFAFSPVANATDILVLTASPTKTIKVVKVRITANATGNNTIGVRLVKRSTANTGGTTTTLTPTANDSDDLPSTATIVSYSANPLALGTGSDIRVDALPVAAVLNPTVSGPINWTWGNHPAKMVILRKGSADNLAINLSGATLPSGLLMYISIEWTEE